LVEIKEDVLIEEVREGISSVAKGNKVNISKNL